MLLPRQRLPLLVMRDPQKLKLMVIPRPAARRRQRQRILQCLEVLAVEALQRGNHLVEGCAAVRRWIDALALALAIWSACLVGVESLQGVDALEDCKSLALFFVVLGYPFFVDLSVVGRGGGVRGGFFFELRAGFSDLGVFVALLRSVKSLLGSIVCGWRIVVRSIVWIVSGEYIEWYSVCYA